MTEDEWNRVIDIDLKGVFLGSKYGIRQMRETGGGVIINTASISGILAMDFWPAYNSAKAGVIHLTRQMALQYGPNNIRANAICPGAIATPMLRRAGGDKGENEVITYFRHGPGPSFGRARGHRAGCPVLGLRRCVVYYRPCLSR